MKVTPEQIKGFMSRIPDHLHRLNYEDIKSECNHYFPSIAAPVIEFTNEKFFFRQQEGGGYNLIYRGRPILNKENRSHPMLADITYIGEKHIDKIKTFGRANKPRESMFYGSLKWTTACIETITNGLEWLSVDNSAMLNVGTWIIEKPMNLVQIPHSIKYIKKFYDQVTYKSDRFDFEKMEQENEELRKELRNDLDFDILMFFADEFAQFGGRDHNRYKLSCYFTDRVLNRIPGYEFQADIDGIIYPSVANSYLEKNIVLKPSSVDEKLKFLSAMMVWITDPLGQKKNTQFIPIEQRVKCDEYGKLQWR